ncbi:MAG: N(6)-L-threonylcarbamoyladenine synthase Kae1 [Candidatus Nitrosothermus koennekii]|nr:MAG: N(6)-L-threonylcarbamoyladenine synthase Kae1 [Candidatus Nitrosothermus koennekii]
MFCLGIESTAHTFSCSIVNEEGILSDVRSIYKPEEGKGIHPREAAKHHADNSKDVLIQALKEADINIKDIDIIAYSKGPGLGPCLRVGAVIARALAAYYNKPLVPVNHAIGHLELGMLLTNSKDPLALLISGGHCMILAMNNKRWRVFGETLDITLGQLLDQFGRAAGFASPCGAIIEQLAKQSNNYIRLPYIVKGNDVSYSGLLTAAKKLLSKHKLEDICYSLQETAFAMLAETAERALAFSEKKELLVVGGVAANQRLASMLEDVCKLHDAKLFIVPPRFAGDCGAQIAWTGLLEYYADITVKPEEASIRQSWRLDTVDITWNRQQLLPSPHSSIL